MRIVWVLGVMVAALAVLALVPALGPLPPLPPEQAFDEYPGYHMWRFVSVEFSKDGGEVATIRLAHPDGSVVAVLHYRLVSSVVFDAPTR